MKLILKNADVKIKDLRTFLLEDLKTKFENCCKFRNNTDFSFNIIYLMETWCYDSDASSNSCFNINYCKVISFQKEEFF